MQIQRPACFGAGTGFSLAAKWLSAHHCADDIAVDIYIADMRMGCDVIDGLVMPCVQSQRQSITGRMNGFDQLRQCFAPITQHMQYGSEHFMLEYGVCVFFFLGWCVVCVFCCCCW